MLIVDDSDFIRRSMEEMGLTIYDFHDNLQVMGLAAFAKLPLQRRLDVILIDTQSVLDDPKTFEVCKAVMNTFQGAYFFHEKKNERARQWVEDQASFLPKILGECAVPMPSRAATLLANQLQFFCTLLQEQQMLQKHMMEFSQELEQVMETAQWEVSRAKRIHEILTPKRTEDIKGVTFYSKYASGQGGGAEFFDLHHAGNRAFMIMVSSASYLISSSLLGVLNNHKSREFDVASFMADARADIAAINGQKKKMSSVDLMVLELDFTDLSLKSHGDHGSKFLSLQKGPAALKVGGVYKLDRGEKFIVFSSGFIFNWKDGDHKEDLPTLVKSHQNLGAPELATELFFNLRHRFAGKGFKRDATVVMMEVKRHGMHQV
jgi:hypothetical protein